MKKCAFGHQRLDNMQMIPQTYVLPRYYADARLLHLGPLWISRVVSPLRIFWINLITLGDYSLKTSAQDAPIRIPV